jgi:Flp pilus assembly protein TadG
VSERGSAAVEALLVAPVLLVLVALLVGGGQLTSDQASVRAVARESGRMAVTASTPTEAVERGAARGKDVAAGYGLDVSRLSVSIDTDSFARGSDVKVGVTYTVELSSLPAFGLLPGSAELTAHHTEPIDRYMSR